MAEAVVETMVETRGLTLTVEETRALQAVWRHDARVDWAAYDRARERVVAWEDDVSTVSAAP